MSVWFFDPLLPAEAALVASTSNAAVAAATGEKPGSGATGSVAVTISATAPWAAFTLMVLAEEPAAPVAGVRLLALMGVGS